MKVTKRKIQAASDFRTFDGYDLDEMQEIFPDIYMDFIYDIRYDVNTVYISKNPNCPYIGVQDSLGDYYVYVNDHPDFEPGWFEVTFTELSNYLE